MMSGERKLAIICSKGSLDMAYPGLILANAARMMGIEANLFFTFWGMDIITKDKVDHLKVTPVGQSGHAHAAICRRLARHDRHGHGDDEAGT
jgi:peroxiredoxin family protein